MDGHEVEDALADNSSDYGNDVDSSQAGFRFGPQDSFNRNSFNYPLSQPSKPEPNPLDTGFGHGHGDFISLITTISQAYQKDRYLDMRSLDGMDWEDFGFGQIFHVSKSDLELEVVSPIDNTKSEKIVNKVVIKKTKRETMSEQDIRSFNRELRILDHFHGTNNIVRLQGVGWLYNNDSISPLPKPVLMLERAAGTLSLLTSPNRNLSPKNIIGKFGTSLPIKFSTLPEAWYFSMALVGKSKAFESSLAKLSSIGVFDGITNGLSALHKSGIVHGDIKVDNVLLFPSYRYDEGVRVRTYIAKLSDFNLAMFDNGGRQKRLGGTSLYLAPESDGNLTFPELKLTDVWSLGVVFAMIASRNEDVLDLDAIRVVAETADAGAFSEVIIGRNNADTQGSTFYLRQVQLTQSLFTTTLRENPQDRNLELLIRRFDTYFERETDQRNRSLTLIGDPPLTDLTVSYGKFMPITGVVKDRITEGLHEIVSAGETDPRNAKAFFELAVICMSKYNYPTASAVEGLQHLWVAAEKGDLRAKALYGRLCRAYGCVPHPQYTFRQHDWLYSASKAGYQIALDDLASKDPERARKALAECAARNIEMLYTEDAACPSHSGTNRQHLYSLGFQVHSAAATGSKEVLEWLLEEHPELINKTNNFGDTALVSACRFGQMETATTLLNHSADSSLSNKAGENALHFLWRFSTEQAESMLEPILRAGADPEEKATFSQFSDEWDLVPKLAGTPIERLASYNRLDLVKLLINRGCPISPRNGNKLRRMLLLAIRLQHTDMQKFLIDYASDHSSDFREDLRPLHEVGWDYKGKRRSYLEASVLGWVRQTGSGIDVPVDFWQACYHGNGWLGAMKTTIKIVLQLSPSLAFNEELMDKIILLTNNEKAYAAFEHLLNKKIMFTDGEHARLVSLRQFCWKGRFSHSTHFSKDRTRPVNSILGLPVLPINYIDQIFNCPGTLAQESLLKGDRTMFNILVRHFGADPSLPFPQDNDFDHQINCYSAIAFTSHQDLWFAHELYRLSIKPFYPFKDTQETPVDWEHPLFHAISRGSWVLSYWLMKKGASIFDKMGSDKTVLDCVFALNSLPPGLLEFLFPCDQEERSITWWITPGLEIQGGYPVFRAIYNAVKFSNQRSDSHVPLNLVPVWLQLLEYYPNVENQPSYSQISVLEMTMRLYHSCFGITSQTLAFDLSLVPSVRSHITVCGNHEFGISYMKNRPVVTFSVYGGGASKSQRIDKIVHSLLMGSPLDAITLKQYWSSRLWRYGLFPSLRHKQCRIFSSTLLFVLGVVGIMTYIVYWVFLRQGWSQTKRLMLIGVIILLLLVALIMGLISVVMVASWILFGVAFFMHHFVKIFVGPSIIPDEFFTLPDPAEELSAWLTAAVDRVFYKDSEAEIPDEYDDLTSASNYSNEQNQVVTTGHNEAYDPASILNNSNEQDAVVAVRRNEGYVYN